MPEEINSTINDEEIDLLDLFIVLLKHRRLILGSLIGVICLTLAGYFIYPSWKQEKVMDQQKAEAIMTLGTGSSLKSIGIQYDVLSLFSSATLLLQSLQEAGIQELGSEEDSIDLTDLEQNVRALNYIRQVFIKKETIEGDPIDQNSLPFLLQEPDNKDSQYFDIKFYHQDSQLAMRFLTRLYQNANTKLLENINDNLEALALTGQVRSSDSTQESDVVLKNAIQIANMAQKFLDGSLQPLELLEAPYYVKDEISLKGIQSLYQKKAIILVFAVFFLSIFLAFFLEFIQNIKEDEERMAKIRKAMNKE